LRFFRILWTPSFPLIHDDKNVPTADHIPIPALTVFSSRTCSNASSLSQLALAWTAGPLLGAYLFAAFLDTWTKSWEFAVSGHSKPATKGRN
jgi:hypothetical protein